MLHSQVENGEFVERYIGGRLTAAERQAFEEHFLACDECFEKLQAAERFAAGMRDAAGRGLLEVPSQVPDPGWFAWGFAATACIALIMAALAAWAYFGQIPRLRGELREIAEQQEKGENRESATQQAIPVEQAEANVPLLLLQASRAGEESARMVLRPDDKRLVLWIEPGPSRYREFQLNVFSSSNEAVVSIDHLILNRNGALAASLPTKQLPAGDFRITLTGQDPPPAALAGEYRLEIRRP